MGQIRSHKTIYTNGSPEAIPNRSRPTEGRSPEVLPTGEADQQPEGMKPTRGKTAEAVTDCRQREAIPTYSRVTARTIATDAERPRDHHAQRHKRQAGNRRKPTRQAPTEGRQPEPRKRHGSAKRITYRENCNFKK